MTEIQTDSQPSESTPPIPDPTPQTISGSDRQAIIRRALTVRSRAHVTFLLVLANLAVFIYGLAVARSQGIAWDYFVGFGRNPQVWVIQHQLGSIRGIDLVRGEWWRLFTCQFVHIGALHLTLNLFTLFLLGRAVEQLWGHFRFLLIYLIGGLGGACAMIAVHPEIGIIKGLDIPGPGAAGASAAIFAIMASEVMWVFLNRNYRPPLNPAWVRSLIVVVVLNAFISTLPMVSAAGHLGGAIAGALTAIPINVQRFSRGSRQLLAFAGIVFLPAIFLGGLQWDRSHDPRWFSIEEQDLYTRVVPTYLKQARSAFTTRDSAALLIEQHPNRRPAEQVEMVRRLLNLHQNELETFAAQLERGGPYADTLVEEARQACQAAIRSLAELFRFGLVCLEARPNWKQDDTAFIEQWNRAKATCDRADDLLNFKPTFGPDWAERQRQ